jgi:RNA polymerase sigma factor (TIGR02999 family)
MMAAYFLSALIPFSDRMGMDSEPGMPSPRATGAQVPAGEAEALFPELYDELRRIAHRQLGAERTGHTLCTTALVHEAYVKLADQASARFASRSHFLAVAAQAMRRILVGYARRVKTEKRGGRWQRLDFDAVEIPVEERAEVLMALDGALERLAALNPRLSRVVECRFFGGMTEEEVADALAVTERTVRRDWIKAKGWLVRELEAADAS